MEVLETILSRQVAFQKIERMAYEIAERNADEEEIILAGIKESGAILSRILVGFLQKIFKGTIVQAYITIDKKDPLKVSLSPVMDFRNKVVIITDDVANSGRTLLYATRPFLEFYPKKIQTLVLVERSYKEFPVTPDYVGLSVSTAFTERIVVETEKNDIGRAVLTAG